MSIIESIKNGARFRHKDFGEPLEWHIFRGNMLVVFWQGDEDVKSYYEHEAEKEIELLPEEETLWVAVSKKVDGVLASQYPPSPAFDTEGLAEDHGDVNYGPGNYTIHKITRTK